MGRLLLLTTKFDRTNVKPWLVDEFASEFIKRQWSVDVVLFDWGGGWGSGTFRISENLVVYSFSVPKNRLRVVLGVLAYIRMFCFFIFARWKTFDLVVGFSVASFFLGVVDVLKFRGLARKSLFILWDFFPVHQVEIGSIKKGHREKLLKLIEGKAIEQYDVVGLMSNKNLDFMKGYHKRINVRKIIVPIWGSCGYSYSEEIKINKTKENNILNVVFGGQITRGRGVEQIIKLADRCAKHKKNISISVYGDGPLKKSVVEASKANPNLRYCGVVCREEYLHSLNGFDVGLIITVPEVSVPSFPSKVIDYFKAALPVLAAVEESTDFGDFIESIGAGVSVISSDLDALWGALMEMESIKESRGLDEMGGKGFRYFNENLEVSKVVDDLLINL
jgi:glycosyltransferase involved in cell wall biosynthesis